MSDTPNPAAAPAAVDLPTRALELAVLKELADQVRAACDAARAGVTEQLVDLNKYLGVKTIEVRLPSFGVIAQITLSSPTHGVAITDEDLFTQWCAREHPSEVVEVPATRTVREAFRKVVLGRLVATDLSTGKGTEWTVVDPDTGLAVEWARVTPPGPQTPTFTWKTDGRQAVAQAWRNGSLDLTEHLALPAPPEE